jgi:hypothetical protein
MLDFDPRDYDSRDRDDRRPDLSRDGYGDQGARKLEPPTRDPGEVAIRHVEPPRGPRREPVPSRRQQPAALTALIEALRL